MFFINFKMGAIDCKIHGLGVGFYETCKHINFAIRSKKYIETFDLPIFGGKLCRDCYEQIDFSFIDNLGVNRNDLDSILSLPEEQAQIIEDTLTLIYEQFVWQRGIVCLFCFKEFDKYS